MKIACVTGATGMIGRRVVAALLEDGYNVRVLTRGHYVKAGVNVFKGDIKDPLAVDRFVWGAHFVFHCAAELYNEKVMLETNVIGTRNLLDSAVKYGIEYFCHISSAGVVGRTSLKFVDEECLCAPQNWYETTKLLAERFVERLTGACRVVILRPTNVVDAYKVGELDFVLDRSLRSLMHIFVKGGECAHIVHAIDVARAALFLSSCSSGHVPQKYFVATDMDPENTLSELWRVHKEVVSKKGVPKRGFLHLPISFPYYLRLVLGKPSNWGDTRYSSQKLLSTGFEYEMTMRDVIKDLTRERN